MPDYETHLWLARKVGIVVGILLAVVAFVGELLSPFGPALLSLLLESTIIGIVAYYSTLVGGAAPDIDLSQTNDNLRYASIPFRKLVKLLRLLIAVVVLFAFVAFTRDGVIMTQAAGALVAVGFGIVVIRAVPDILHQFMPGHRKLTHELSFWAITGLFGVLAIQQVLRQIQTTPFIQTYLPLSVGIPIFLGVVTHVSLDTVNDYVQAYAPDPIKRRAAQLAPWVPKHKPVIADIPQLARIAFDSRAPGSIRIFVVLTVLYGVFPIDMIPDTLIGIGWIEDLGIYLIGR